MRVSLLHLSRNCLRDSQSNQRQYNNAHHSGRGERRGGGHYNKSWRRGHTHITHTSRPLHVRSRSAYSRSANIDTGALGGVPKLLLLSPSPFFSCYRFPRVARETRKSIGERRPISPASNTGDGEGQGRTNAYKKEGERRRRKHVPSGEGEKFERVDDQRSLTTLTVDTIILGKTLLSTDI